MAWSGLVTGPHPDTAVVLLQRGRQKHAGRIREHVIAVAAEIYVRQRAPLDLRHNLRVVHVL